MATKQSEKSTEKSIKASSSNKKPTSGKSTAKKPSPTEKLKSVIEKIEKEEDPNTVKINVVDEPQDNKKDFKTVIGDIKERTAQNFIATVIRNCPSRIKIGAKNYYSAEYLKQIEGYHHKRYDDLLTKCKEDDLEEVRIVKGLTEKSVAITKMAEDIMKTAIFWRRVSMISILVGSILIAALATPAISGIVSFFQSKEPTVVVEAPSEN